MEVQSSLRHNTRLQALRRTDKAHPPPPQAKLFADRDRGEDVTAGAATRENNPVLGKNPVVQDTVFIRDTVFMRDPVFHKLIRAARH